jgi:hypothetical protein
VSAALVRSVTSLREQGLAAHDPVRFRYLQALAERLPQQAPSVQALLARKLEVALHAYALAAGAQRVAASLQDRPRNGTESPLAQLNQELRERAQADQLAAASGEVGSATDMKSVRAFGEVWSQISAEQQVDQALQRGPENAGPLNAHRLMLRSLALMRSLSPDYLRRYVAQMDSLLWLDQATAPPVAAASRSAVRAGAAAGGAGAAKGGRAAASAPKAASKPRTSRSASKVAKASPAASAAAVSVAPAASAPVLPSTE